MAIDRLTALDRMMLWASRRWPQDVGALAILDGGPLFDEAGRFQIDDVRAAIQSRLHLVPRFRQLIYHPRRGLGGPLWVEARTFDLRQHVKELRLEPPAGEPEMLAAVERLLRRSLDPSRPLWEMWFLTGLPERRVGLFMKIHHTIGDGIAAMATAVTFLDPAPITAAAAAPRWIPVPWPSTAALSATTWGGACADSAARCRCSFDRWQPCADCARHGQRSASCLPRSRPPRPASTAWSAPTASLR